MVMEIMPLVVLMPDLIHSLIFSPATIIGPTVNYTAKEQLQPGGLLQSQAAPIITA